MPSRPPGPVDRCRSAPERSLDNGPDCGDAVPLRVHAPPSPPGTPTSHTTRHEVDLGAGITDRFARSGWVIGPPTSPGPRRAPDQLLEGSGQMCGIAGEIVLDRSGAPDRSAVERMTDTMQCRGPDGAGSWASGWVALGH